jgi:signal transduction histidine kinase
MYTWLLNAAYVFVSDSDLAVLLIRILFARAVLADSLLWQFFYNLIYNSLKHGQKVTQIRVYYKKGKDQLKLIYEDNGVGISADEKEKIFMECYGRGKGYGLYLIRKMCEVYGWSITETGEHGKCAQFTMTIPKMGKNKKLAYFL